MDDNKTASSVIFQDIKEMIGPSSDDECFNVDLLSHINSTLNILQQLGVGPKKGFSITLTGGETWSDFLPGIEDENVFQMVKTYVYLKVRLIFDPPTGSVLTAYQEQIKELESRLNYAAETDWSK